MTPIQALIVALPLAQLPGLPPIPSLPTDVGRTVTGVVDRLPQRPLTELRQLRVRELLHRQRKFVEADPHGAPMVRSELLAYSPSSEALERAIADGFSVVRERVLEGLDARVVVLNAPPKVATHRALARLRALDPDGTYDFNHIYTESGVVEQEVGASPLQNDLPQARTVSSPRSPIRVGLVDGGVDASHPVFEGVTIYQHGCGDVPVPSAHGTAVASLIAGNANDFHGAAPGAELYAADIYCGRPTGGAMDDIAEAVGWLVGQRVAVISISLVGPKNALLEGVVRAASAKNHLIVAAVGNDGPAARPLYPAAYPDVIGVTAVDMHQHVLLEACRGPHVDFSAPGADMSAAVMSRAFAPVRGTSFAAPLVAGLLATQLKEPDNAAVQLALAELARGAIDLGERGPDVIYGKGLVGENLRVELAAVAAAPNNK